MTIEQFAKSVPELEKSSAPLLQALHALRMCDLGQVRNPENGYFCEWSYWTDDGSVQTPQTYVKKPELRC